MKQKFIYVDVDDTLVRSYSSKRIPIPHVVRYVQKLFDDGAVLFCWSSGGAEYAEKTAKELGIDDCFTCFLPKPHILIDDQNPSDWKYMTVIHPTECS